jgi:hypothetical protein
MNFEQAVQEMIDGKRVRLSDWLGYWYMPDGKFIKVFTRDGDILDKPNVSIYQNRNDWEIATETRWSFDMALRFLKNGKRIERNGWNGKGMWIQMVGGGTFSMNDEVYDATPYLQIKSVNGTVTPWLPSQTDILANDWQIVNS